MPVGFWVKPTIGGGGGGSLPTWEATGAVADGTGNVTPVIPSHQADDILLIFSEHTDGEAAMAAPSGGWAAVADSPSSGTGTGGATLDIWWLRASSGSTTNPTLVDPGTYNHIVAFVAVVRGCTTSGNPWDVTAASNETTNDTSGSITGDTTTVNNCLCVMSCATGTDVGSNGTAQFSAWANSDLANVTERADYQRTVGNGGNIGVATGEKATAGSVGATTFTVANGSSKGMHFMALKP